MQPARTFAIGLVIFLHGGIARAESVDFDRDIRPILSDRCYLCHGPDSQSRQAELRLDTRDGILESVVIPGEPDESELIVRIFAKDDDLRMPPPESKRTLTTAEKALIWQWIAEGAKYSDHWSFQPLAESVQVPPVHDESWPTSEIDRFVLARLESEGYQPTERATPLRLLRRISLDLTGLPPTADEIAEFASMARLDVNAAIAAHVEKLLESPAFGEHLAVAWLDAARYADSFGYQSDQLNTQWPYRDWVVRALNQNMPYKQFITWQLAGDLITPATDESILATAFNRMHRLTNEGGSIADEWLVENAADRVHTFGTALLGLTLECARCHDHKYDPISSRDYYSLFAFFNSIDENGLYDHASKVPAPSLLLPTDEQRIALEKARLAVDIVEAEIITRQQEGNERFHDWLAHAIADPSSATRDTADLVGYFTFDEGLDPILNQVPDSKVTGKGPGLVQVNGVRGKAVRLDGDHGIVFPELLVIDRWDNFSVDVWLRNVLRNPQPVVLLHRSNGTDTGYNGFDAMLRDGLLEVRLYRVWPGNGIGVRTLQPIVGDTWQHIAITYDGSSSARGIQIYVDGKPVSTEVLRDHIYKRACVATYGTGDFSIGERFRDRGFHDGLIDELRVYHRALTPLEVRHLHDGTALTEALGNPVKHESELRQYYFQAVDATVREACVHLRQARQKLVEAEEWIHEVSVMRELPEPRATHILARGAYDAPRTGANRVQRDVLADLLIPLPANAPRNRLGLAQWLTDPRHPLTSRVAVNRVWANFFGRGLVGTPENFGRQGESPTHPELLDWLARDFINHGWDVKRLCRQIVLSATYQQDSRAPVRLRERDPDNRLLARGPRRRLSGEQIRDLALAASGLLDRKVGGPPVSPYQPGEDLWREANSMSPPYRQSVGADLHRRSLYSVWKRTAPLPNMIAFDVPSREVCVVARSTTTTPLQSLVLLNDKQFVECAQELARDELGKSKNIDECIRRAFVRLTGREPDTIEQEELGKFFRSQREILIANEGNSAMTYLGLDDSSPKREFEIVDWAALAITCQAIMNLDATTYVR